MPELINAGPSFASHPRECRLAHSSALQSELSLDLAIFSPLSTTELICTWIPSVGVISNKKL